MKKGTRQYLKSSVTKEMDRIEYYDKVNWASALVDITILIIVGITKNYWLLILLIFTGKYTLQKYKDVWE